MVDKYDGMRAYVEECYPHPTKGWLHVASKMPRLTDPLGYEQLGIFKGNTEGVREGALIEIWFKEYVRPTTLKGWLKDFAKAFDDDNIAHYRLVENGADVAGARGFVYGWLRFLGVKK